MHSIKLSLVLAPKAILIDLLHDRKFTPVLNSCLDNLSCADSWPHPPEISMSFLRFVVLHLQCFFLSRIYTESATRSGLLLSALIP